MGSAKNLENLSPKQFLKFDVFFSTSKHRLSVTDFVVDCVLYHLLKNRFLVRVLNHEVLMAFVGRYDEVDQDADFVAETLVIFLMSFLNDLVKLRF